MNNGELTPHEAGVIRQLLARHNITYYEIVGAVEEGQALPGSVTPRDLESLSGYVVTSTTAYSFWLNWENGTYTLGEQDGTWNELTPNDIQNNDEILEGQQHLKQKSM